MDWIFTESFTTTWTRSLSHIGLHVQFETLVIVLATQWWFHCQPVALLSTNLPSFTMYKVMYKHQRIRHKSLYDFNPTIEEDCKCSLSNEKHPAILFTLFHSTTGVYISIHASSRVPLHLSTNPIPSLNVERQEGCFSGRNGELEVRVSHRERSTPWPAKASPPLSKIFSCTFIVSRPLWSTSSIRRSSRCRFWIVSSVRSRSVGGSRDPKADSYLEVTAVTWSDIWQRQVGQRDWAGMRPWESRWGRRHCRRQLRWNWWPHLQEGTERYTAHRIRNRMNLFY